MISDKPVLADNIGPADADQQVLIQTAKNESTHPLRWERRAARSNPVTNLAG